MTYVHSFYGYIPPVRNDAIPWTQVRVEEGTTATGTFTAVQTVTLNPVDSNPLVPMERDFTVTLATLAVGYFRVIFIDANTSESAPSQAVLLPQLSPTESMGLIGDLIGSILGETYIALRASENYGDEKILARIEAAKYASLPAAVAGQAESTYSFVLRDYIAKRAALELIPAGMEYWMMESITRSATGTNETVSYVDRVKVLQELAKYLQREVLALSANPGVSDNIASFDSPEVSGTGDLVTEDPYHWRPAFGRRVFQSHLPPYSVFRSNEGS